VVVGGRLICTYGLHGVRKGRLWQNGRPEDHQAINKELVVSSQAGPEMLMK
jgi:hypothetical protein